MMEATRNVQPGFPGVAEPLGLPLPTSGKCNPHRRHLSPALRIRYVSPHSVSTVNQWRMRPMPIVYFWSVKVPAITVRMHGRSRYVPWASRLRSQLRDTGRENCSGATPLDAATARSMQPLGWSKDARVGCLLTPAQQSILLLWTLVC